MRTYFASFAAIITLSLVVLAACGATTPAATTAAKPLLATDANGTTIVIPAKAPQRIVSLSATESETLGALGLTAHVVGVDAFTDYPTDIASKTKVSDANGSPNVEQIIALNPDLVLSFGGETAAADKQLLQSHINVVDMPAKNLADSLTEIRLVGQLTHTESAANQLVGTMQQRINTVQQKVTKLSKVSVYMEVGYTPSPPYAFGGKSFGDELITDAGGSNIFSNDTSGGGYPSVSEDAIIKDNPQVIILTESPQFGGDPTKVGQRPGWSSIAAVQSNHIYAINPDTVQRPGPRIVDALEQIAKDLHPEAFSS